MALVRRRVARIDKADVWLEGGAAILPLDSTEQTSPMTRSKQNRNDQGSPDNDRNPTSAQTGAHADPPVLTGRARRLLGLFRDEPSPGRVLQFSQLSEVLKWDNAALDRPSAEAVRKLMALGFIRELNLGFALTAEGAQHIRGSYPLKNLYVIRLDDAVREDRRFKKQNPDYGGSKPCMYVGSTGHTPEKRFQQHRDGYKASSAVRKHGRYIMWKKFDHLNPIPSHEAEVREAALADDLRRKGYGVWQG
jgi:hypothetical protein